MVTDVTLETVIRQQPGMLAGRVPVLRVVPGSESSLLDHHRALLVVATLVYYPFSPGGRQRTNMKRAARHIPVLKAQIAHDPRFASVEFITYTGSGGSLLIDGEVATQGDADVLKAILDKSNPPSPIVFRVRPITESSTRPNQ